MAFDTYEVIAPINVHLGDDSVMENFEMGSIVVEVLVEGETKKDLHQRCLSYAQVANN